MSSRNPDGWLCRKCGARHERTKQRCACGGKRPAPRVPKHARTLQRDSYEDFREVNRLIHGVDDECAVCGRPPGQHRRLDRDHDHKTGRPRGLLCVKHNQMLQSRYSAAELRAGAAFLDRVDDHYRDAA